MRVLVVHNRYRTAQPSGEDVVVDQDLRALRRAGHEVEVYQQESDSIAASGALARAALPARVVWSPGDARAVGRAIAGWRPDVVHVHNTFPLISPSVLGAARRHGVPVVATLHNYRLVCASGLLLRDGAACTTCVERGPLPGLVHGCYRGSRAATAPVTASIALHGALRTWVRGVRRFIVMTEFAKGLLARAGLPAGQIDVRSHGVDEAPARRDGPGEGFLYVGRLSREKGVDLLVDAWAPELGRLDVVGDGPLAAELAATVRDRGLDVGLHGALNHTEVRRRMARARAVVVPSRAFETFGLSAVEAMAAGVPVVVAGHGALAELVDSTGGGLTFRPQDGASLRRAVAGLDTATSLDLGARARRAYVSRFTMDASMRTLEAVYRAAVGEASDARVP